MNLHLNLLTIDSVTTHYPDHEMRKCTLLGSDNSTYEADLLPSETELLLTLKRLKRKLSSTEFKTLTEQISKYAEEKEEYTLNTHDID